MADPWFVVLRGKVVLLKRSQMLVPVLALIVIAVDQVTKFIVSASLPLYGTWSPFPGPNPFFQIVYVYNTGAAFGLFKDLGTVFVLIALVVIGAIVYYSRRLAQGQWLFRIALGLQLGGALGNLTDRVRLGHVIDFIDVGIGATRWYTSNLADVSIVAGVILLGFAMFREERQPKKSKTGDAGMSSVQN
jgi:signal peptidase II